MFTSLKVASVLLRNIEEFCTESATHDRLSSLISVELVVAKSVCQLDVSFVVCQPLVEYHEELLESFQPLAEYQDEEFVAVHAPAID